MRRATGLPRPRDVTALCAAAFSVEAHRADLTARGRRIGHALDDEARLVDALRVRLRVEEVRERCRASELTAALDAHASSDTALGRHRAVGVGRTRARAFAALHQAADRVAVLDLAV